MKDNETVILFQKTEEVQKRKVLLTIGTKSAIMSKW